MQNAARRCKAPADPLPPSAARVTGATALRFLQSLGGSRCCATRPPFPPSPAALRRIRVETPRPSCVARWRLILQRCIRRHTHFTALFVAQARTLYFDLPVSKTDAPVLRSVPADIAAALTRRARPGHLFGTQTS